jgi:hypothetical protein
LAQFFVGNDRPILPDQCKAQAAVEDARDVFGVDMDEHRPGGDIHLGKREAKAVNGAGRLRLAEKVAARLEGLFGDRYLPYVVTSSFTVPQGKTLTVSPGAIVKFDSGLGLSVYGALNAQGNSASSVYFTSLKDDSVGGDTVTTDGAPAAGDWTKIYISSGVSSTFTHAVIAYGGGGGWGVILNDGGTLTLDSSEVATSSNKGVNHISGTSTITSSSIHNSSTYGLYAAAGAVYLGLNNTYYSNSTADTYIASGVKTACPTRQPSVVSAGSWRTAAIQRIPSRP